jgi:hypothetical protein
MDQIMGKVGGYWFSQKANAEMNGAGDDLNVRNRYDVVILTQRSLFPFGSHEFLQTLSFFRFWLHSSFLLAVFLFIIDLT